MSTMQEKLEQRQESGGAAQRSYLTLLGARGGVRQEGLREGRQVVSIGPMGVRSYWQHSGSGRWDAMTAMYTRVEASE